MSSETFFKHIEKGDLEKVKEMLQPGSGIDVNGKDTYSRTALMNASVNGYIEIVKLLLEKGADINANRNGKTPLIYASVEGHIEIVKLLLEKGADVNTKDKGEEGETALIYASDHGYTEIVKLLLEKGADVNAKDKRRRTALINASQLEENIEIAKLLLEKGADINAKDAKGKTAFMYASENGHIKILKLLLEKGADIDPKDKYSQRAFINASAKEHIEIVKLLLEKGVDVNAKNRHGQTALITASYNGYIEIVKLLLEKGADINSKDEGEEGETALMCTLDHEHIEILKLLLEKGADINDKDKEGNTVLILASRRNRIESVKLLLEKGADINAKNKRGRTAFMQASDYGYIEIAKLLLEKGADVNDKDRYSRTAVMNASVNGDIEMVKLLLEKGADINAKDRDGSTALMGASVEGHIEILKLLLEKGVDVNAKNENNETAADIARSDDIKELLEAKMDTRTIEMWKGFTRDDIERLNGIFEDNAKNYSLCPVCLKYVERSEACIYMYHNCNIIKGSYYHKRLYQKFGDSKGIIKWCTICSRICYGHAHYELARHDSKKYPELLISDKAVNLYEDDCRVSNHGGGLPEKLLRFRRLRKVAKELQDEIGKISKRRALDKLVEEVWNAPLDEDTGAVNEIMKSKEWKNNINTRKFRSGKNSSNSNNANAPNIPFEGKKPNKLNSGMNDIMRMEDDNIIQFHHKQKDGSIKEHGCTEESLEKYIATKLGEFGTANFGYCFLYPDDCKARLHPEEVKGHIPDKLYNPYKKAFNIAFQGQRGGNRENVFQEAKDAQCVVSRKNTTSKNRNNRNSRITTNRNHRK